MVKAIGLETIISSSTQNTITLAGKRFELKDLF
jgi:hypothetical protein